jgi:hypothetical protein
MRKIVKKRRMLTRADMTHETRAYVVALIERERKILGSRMSAYERIASMVGVSSDWLQKIIGRRFCEVEAHEFLNIQFAYERLCSRVERAADHEEQRVAALQGRTNAADKGGLAVASRAARTSALGENDP